MHGPARAAAAASIATAALVLALSGAASAAEVVVHISNAQFQTNPVNIQANDTVKFVNDDSFAHDVSFEAGFGTGAAGSLAPGANWSHTFSAAGTFKFRCQLHSTNFDTGMVGQVVVGAASPPPPAAPTPGFEWGAALAAIGACALVSRRLRSG
jgi:plastocyanin